MASSDLRGVIVPVITPTDSREDVDEPAFRQVLRRLVKAKVNAIFVGGSAGEGPLLSDGQWRRMVEIALDEVAGALPLLGGAIDTSARRVCEKARVLDKIGYRHFVVTPTFYIAVKTPEEHLRLFGQAKEAGGDMEMVAYNIPQCTASVLAVDTVCLMAKRGWIRYCKESSGDVAYLKELICRGKDVGLTVLAGDELTSREALLAGAGGIVPVCANYDPTLFLRLFDARVRGNDDELSRMANEVLALREILVLSGPCWLSGIKYSVAALGIGAGRPVSPLEPADAQRIARIDARVAADRAAGNVSL
jgi:4-hydroxy-tetrahydrodipicolinate synthase